jgi:hypothetical protein
VPRHYCTLFDANFLVRALALHESLRSVDPTMTLHAFCMDEQSAELLGRLRLDRVNVVPLPQLERDDPGLASVKGERTRVEYFWTATPSVALWCLEHVPEADSITYLDADLYFFSSPDPLYDELGDGSVLIVPHNYAPEHAHLEPASGKYNVELVAFRRDEEGLRVLRWWRDRCLEWCFNRVEDGKLGDQKYLEQFEELSPGVVVTRHKGAGVAPWNASRYRFEQAGDGVLVDGEPLVFYHFQSLELLEGSSPLLRRLRRTVGSSSDSSFTWATENPVGQSERALAWEPYLDAIERGRARVLAVDPAFAAGTVPVRALAAAALRSRLGAVYRGVRPRAA